MLLHVAQVEHLHDYVVRLRFDNGEVGELDLSGELDGEVFGPLRDPSLFATIHVDPELGTIAWSNGADLAPEYLLDLIRARVSTQTA